MQTLNLEEVHNFRDFGDLTTKDGRKVKKDAFIEAMI